MPNTFWQVAPRYTAGSPGQVDAATAKRIASQELAIYSQDLAGLHGPEDQARAQRLGTSGIVESVTDWADGSRVITDEITGASRRERPKTARQKADADRLAADLRILQDLIARRGWAWLAKWTALYSGTDDRSARLQNNADQASRDAAALAPGGDYDRTFPNCPDPRD